MPWISQVKAVLEMYLSGESAGEAAVNLLYGTSNPCGRLAESFPLRIEDSPAYPYYGVEKDDVVYREGILVGYRHYETMKKKVLFPFGHGLSYTSFDYSDLKVDKEQIKDTDSLTVSVTVANTGNRSGKEVVQLYVAGNTDKIVRPIRELKAFDKVSLAPGESKKVTFVLRKRAFAYWDTEKGWTVASGAYQIQIGRSAADIVLATEVRVDSTDRHRPVFTLNTPMGDMMDCPAAMGVLQSVIGGFVSQMGEADVLSQEAMLASAASMPLRGIAALFPDVGIEQMEQLLEAINQAVAHS